MAMGSFSSLSALVGAGLILTSFSNPSRPLLGARAELSLTEQELKAFDGTDSSKPIYLAISGTIFDVSASPSFYGPGGHYHHFVGRDATRAWITECWDEPEQLTWRLDGVEAMFMPKYLDEMIAHAAKGEDMESLGLADVLGSKQVAAMAEKARARFGKVTEGDKVARRISDKKEAEAKKKQVLEHWFKFFAANPKYIEVGKVILDEKNEPKPPPPPCKAAMEKRPMKGGRMEPLMGEQGSIMNMKTGKEDKKKPDFLANIDSLKNMAGGEKDKDTPKAAEAAEAVDEEEEEDLVKDEL